MERRTITFAIAAVMLIAMFGIALRLPVPYVVLVPGPVTDTLGNVPAGDSLDGGANEPVIDITGATTQPTTGHLYLTTVGITPGSCSAHPTLWQAIKAWFDSTKAVEPHQVQCPPGVSSQAVQQQGVDEMSKAQADAIYAALTQLGYKPTGTAVFIQSVTAGLPAAKTLKPDDQIVRADDTAIRRPQQLVDVVQATKPGRPVSLVIKRDGARRTVEVNTAPGGAKGKARLGVEILGRPTFDGIDVSIGIDPNVIGGPSAGAALALGIIDKLTPGGLTGGRTIAGTGTINRRGVIGPIGGIQQKIAAASSAGATVFFAPASECADAKRAAPSSLTLVSVSTLRGAVDALQAIKSGSQAFPHC